MLQNLVNRVIRSAFLALLFIGLGSLVMQTNQFINEIVPYISGLADASPAFALWFFGVNVQTFFGIVHVDAAALPLIVIALGTIGYRTFKE